jgi:nicotinate phosphoribosyltransferase
MLDDAGLHDVKIIVSNQLDEHVIKSLEDQGAPIDGFGVGTRLITGKESAALDGIYKLSGINGNPKLKISENIEKISLPGDKKILRLIDQEGYFYADAVSLDKENQEDIGIMYHPVHPSKYKYIHEFQKEELLRKVMHNGKLEYPQEPVISIQKYASHRLKQLSIEYKRFINPHLFKVGISHKLKALKDKLMNESGKT